VKQGGREQVKGEKEDKFRQMISATADTDLKLSDFAPRSMLVAPTHEVSRARYAAIDFHNHLDSLEPASVIKVMDACNIERIVNITMCVGDEAFRAIERFQGAAPDRFSTIAWMDWTGLHAPGFFTRSVERLERLVERGARGLKVWKDLGLELLDTDGTMLRVDDERLSPLFEKAGELGIPVMFHIADPDAFFIPIDRFNERYEELSAHPDWSFYGSHFSKQELLDQRDRVIGRHPGTTFVGAHVAEHSEDLGSVSRQLDAHPNLFIDIGARTAELGRQPYSAREFFLKHADRILFGTDLLPEEEMYRLHFRFLETADEYFDYPSHASRQGRWQIYGLFLPDDVLRKIYRENALKLLKD
jgi:predicted TIM-barrel fold metal-dependent hydrolase